ncbi:hypothetical protein PybrP1_001510 [[Pythium] brassicae (nom. inval.)]|nr:hypothetical protein PybrP1_001510 [[Pythium] brassicae (nom. inval.)]
MEWLELETHRKQAKLRRQQRELRRQQKEREAHERHLQLLARRCAEMQHEEQLSIAMEQLFAREAARRRLEAQREEDMRVFREANKARKRAQALGVSVSTPGLSGLSRLHDLESRIDDKALALTRAAAAKQRLDALPATRDSLKKLSVRYAATLLQKKVECAVLELRCDRFESLFDPAAPSVQNRSELLLNHESANGLTPVLAAIVCRKLSVLRRLLELGAAPDCETSWGMTPLLVSVMTDDVVTVSILKEFSVDLDYETRFRVRALHLAADKGRVEILKALLRGGASVNALNAEGRSSLMQAVISNQFEAVKVLLAFGADTQAQDPSGLTALQWANTLDFACIASLLSSSVASTSLYAQLVEDEENEEDHGCGVVAASAGRISAMQRAMMIEKAMADRNLPRVLQLLEEPSFSPNYEDRHGNTPFLVACEVGSGADILYCLGKKAIPTHQNHFGRNGLMAACYRGDTDVLELLVKAGADLRTRDYRGWDSYRYLNHYEHPDIVAKLTEERRASDPLPPLKLGDPLHSIASVRSVKVLTTPALLASTSKRTSSDSESGGNMDTTHFDNVARLTERDHETCRSNEDDRESTSGGSDGGNSEDLSTEAARDPAIRKWGTRQQGLKKDHERREAFDHEREMILKALRRGRRNGLIAPLPGDPAGRRKFPVCDNCTSCRARKRCAQCDQVLCEKCHARLHELGHRRHHQYGELEPEIYVGRELRDVVVERQRNSLKYLVDASTELTASMRATLSGERIQNHPDALESLSTQAEPEIARFNRAKRLAQEKQVTQTQINVPVASAKHATRAGEGDIFTSPVEIELANLYIVQKKYAKAAELLEQTKLLVGESLGALHPTMLKVSIGLARIQMVRGSACVCRRSSLCGKQETGHADACVQSMQSVLGLFESILAPEHSDMVLGLSVLLAGLVGVRSCVLG